MASDTIRGLRARGRRALISGIGLALAMGVPTASAIGAAAPDIVLRVDVADAAGGPVAGAAVLTTVLWNSKADYRRHGRAVGKVLHADREGRLAVPIKLDRRQRASVARNGGWLNVSMVVLDTSGHPIAQRTTSRHLGRTHDEAATPTANRVERMTVDPGRRELRLPARAPSVERALASCTYYWDADAYSLRYAQIGELHVDQDVPYARLTYGTTADTTFDVVARSPAQTWSVVGSVHVGNTESTSVYANAGGQTNYHWALRTQFRFAQMKLFKDCLGGPYRAWVGPEELHALEWTSGGMTRSSTLTQPPRTPGYSYTFGPDTGWARATSAFTKWTAAVSVFGASIGAQSGASTNVKIEYGFGTRQTHWLYGDTALPGSSLRVFQDTP